MNKYVIHIIGYVLCMLCITMPLAADESLSEIKESRMKIHQMEAKRLSKQLSKTTQKESQRLAKDGWRTFSGDLSLAELLEKDYLVQYEYNENFIPKYIISESSWEDTDLQNAESKALEFAKINLYWQVLWELAALEESQMVQGTLSAVEAYTTESLSSQIQSITEHTEYDNNGTEFTTSYFCMGEKIAELYNKQIDDDNAISDVKVYSAAAERTCFQLPFIKAARILTKIYRKTKDDKYEVLIRLFTPAQKCSVKIGDLYYYLDDSDSFMNVDDIDAIENKPNTAIVTYHWRYANLDSVNIPAKVVYGDRTYDVVGVCDNAFYEGKNIRQVTYPVWIDMSKSALPTTAQLLSFNPQPPLLTMDTESLTFFDDSEDNCIDANENGIIRFKIKNNGNGAANNCEARIKLSGTTDGISVQSVKLPTIAVNQTYEVSIPVSSDMHTQDGKATFAIEVFEPDGWGVAPFNYTIPTKAYIPPQLQVVDYKIASPSGEVHKMESFTLSYNIQNTKYGDAEDIKVKVNIPDNIYVMGDVELSYPLIKPGEIKSNQLVLVANNNYIGANIPVTVELNEKHGKYAENRTIEIPLAQTSASVTNITVQEEKKRFRLVSDEDKALTIDGKPRLSMLTNTSVSILRPDWFNQYHNPNNVKSPFPYTAIKLELKGDKESIEMAKQRLSLTMGGKHIVEAKDDSETNTIWFLVHCRNEFIDLDCGDGCEPINIWGKRLEPHKIYHCSISVNIPK